jgi:hypothetical protein
MAKHGDFQLAPTGTYELGERYKRSREMGGDALFSTIRREEYAEAGKKVEAILTVISAHLTLKDASGVSLLSTAQIDMLNEWHETHGSVIWHRSYHNGLMGVGVTFGFSEEEIADLQACAQDGLRVFEPELPEAE